MKRTLKRLLLFLFIVISSFYAQAQNLQKTKTDGDWAAKQVVKANTSEAELMIRVGDIDNLNYGWTAGFSPFLGKSTGTHAFPWTIDRSDPKGTDRIYVPSSFVDHPYDPIKENCYPDGYSDQLRKPEAIIIPLDRIKELNVKAANIQFFIDDFQQVNKCSRFQVTLNNKLRLTQMEELLRYIDQSGPTGKLITVELNREQIQLIQDPKVFELSIFIDDPITRAGDGYAIDFVKLLINPKDKKAIGSVEGIVIDANSKEPIKNALVRIDNQEIRTDELGKFSLDDLAVGYWTAQASATNYERNTITVDVFQKELKSNSKVKVYTIPLKKEEGIKFNGDILKEGDKTTLNNIQFERSKFYLLPKSKMELDKLIFLMQQKSQLEIELLGHTSNEGLYSENILLSKNRAEACRNYLIEKGIHPDRIKAIGYGPDKPVTKNRTEQERVQNRRVEVLITRMY